MPSFGGGLKTETRVRKFAFPAGCHYRRELMNRVPLAVAFAAIVAVGASACTPPATQPASLAPPRQVDIAGEPTQGPPPPPLVKMTRLEARIPEADELPGLIGRLQPHRLAEQETLLMIGEAAGVGFRALRAANPILRQYVPRPGTDLIVPTRFILPRSAYRGLVVNVAEMRLYMFPADARPGERVPIQTWPVGIGHEVAQSPTGPFRVTSKDANPTWVVPDSIYETMSEPKRVVPPGPDNPLGAYRIRTSIPLYAFHGTNDPWTVGRPTTHGCIRLYAEDIERLYGQVSAGFPGEFVYEPVKLGRSEGRVYAEVHPDVYQRVPDLQAYALDEVQRAGLGSKVDLGRLRRAVSELRGVPEDVTRR
jgi:L,D-transpeptidase ErfK/SrfK